MAMTVCPIARARWIDATPTPPDAPVMSTICPARQIAELRERLVRGQVNQRRGGGLLARSSRAGWS